MSFFIPSAKVSATLRRSPPLHQLGVIAPRDKSGQHVIWALRDCALGKALVAVCEDHLCWLGFSDKGQANLLARFKADWGMAECVEGTHPLMKKALSKEPQDLPLLVSGTPFQLAVWAALLQIPRGALVRYGDLAAYIGRPRSARAVGNAVGANPVSWVIPCHRVGHSNGSLKGFGWGEACKRRLLELEGALTPSENPASRKVRAAG